MAIAHRAGNELASLRTAEAIGADVIEADLWLYRQRLEVRHLKTLGPLPLLWDRWQLASARTPRLELAHLLAELSPVTRLLLDLKGRDIQTVNLVMEAVSQYRPDGPMAVCSRNWALAKPFHRARNVAVAYSIGSQQQLQTYLTTRDTLSPHAVSIHVRLLNEATVATLKERATAVISWPINTNEQLQQLGAWGVDGMTSDNVELLSRLVAGSRR